MMEMVVMVMKVVICVSLDDGDGESSCVWMMMMMVVVMWMMGRIRWWEPIVCMHMHAHEWHVHKKKNTQLFFVFFLVVKINSIVIISIAASPVPLFSRPWKLLDSSARSSPHERPHPPRRYPCFRHLLSAPFGFRFFPVFGCVRVSRNQVPGLM
jgi:hypothetical protein